MTRTDALIHLAAGALAHPGRLTEPMAAHAAGATLQQLEEKAAKHGTPLQFDKPLEEAVQAALDRQVEQLPELLPRVVAAVEDAMQRTMPPATDAPPPRGDA